MTEATRTDAGVAYLRTVMRPLIGQPQGEATFQIDNTATRFSRIVERPTRREVMAITVFDTSVPQPTAGVRRYPFQGIEVHSFPQGLNLAETEGVGTRDANGLLVTEITNHHQTDLTKLTQFIKAATLTKERIDDDTFFRDAHFRDEYGRTLAEINKDKTLAKQFDEVTTGLLNSSLDQQRAQTEYDPPTNTYMVSTIYTLPSGSEIFIRQKRLHSGENAYTIVDVIPPSGQPLSVWRIRDADGRLVQRFSLHNNETPVPADYGIEFVGFLSRLKR